MAARSQASAANTRTPGEVDVVVVGAGLAGLTAATRLQESGARVVTLEARDEVGGRLRSRSLGGAAVDLGGEFVGPHHRRVRALARDLGLRLQGSGLARSPTLWRLDEHDRVGYLPRLSPGEVRSAARALRGLAKLAKGVPPQEPWEAADAASLDADSLAQWLAARGVRGRARLLFAAMFEGLATTRADQLSMLHALWWIARAGGPLPAMRDVNAKRVPGGAQEICRRLAEHLREPVHLSTPVTRISQNEDGVLAEAAGVEGWRARHAAVCVPLPALGRIEFEPPLDQAQRALSREVGFGKAVSIVVAAPARSCFRHGTLIGGEALPLAWRTPTGAKGLFLADRNERSRSEMVQELCRLFGLHSETAEAEIVRWDDEPFIGGTYVAFGPRQLSTHGPHLRRSHGRIHFAAAERGTWPDSMEGAVESAGWAAESIMSSLTG